MKIRNRETDEIYFEVAPVQEKETDEETSYCFEDEEKVALFLIRIYSKILPDAVVHVHAKRLC